MTTDVAPGEPGEEGAALLDYVADTEADLLVTGAHGHTRLQVRSGG